MTQPSEQDVNSQEDRAVRIMRSVVINMGILLVIGTIALFVAVIMKSNSSSDKKAESKATTQDETFAQGECKAYKQADVPLTGKVISSDTDNYILTITTTDQVIAYNLCTGEVIAKFQSVGNN